MRNKSLAWRFAFMFAVFTATFVTGTNRNRLAFGQRRVPELNVSPEEQNLAKAIIAAPDAAAKLKAAAALINKYPKTLLRPRVATAVADSIADLKDPATKISLAQEYEKTFNEESEHNLITPVLVGGYTDAGQSDQAFALGAAFLAKQPDSLRVLVTLTLAGTDQAKKQNNRFVTTSIQYAAKAIEIIETDKRPAEMNDALWNYYKGLRPNLYQSMGLLNVIKGDHAEAKARFSKAAEITPGDPFNYLMLAGILNDEYKTEAKRVQEMPEGQAKQDALAKVLPLLDTVIDAYAHMVAVSESDVRFAQVRQQYLQDLETYYKFRHHSTEGLQQLIDKYKLAAK